MARRVFFAFDYADVQDFRANVVRKSWVTRGSGEAAGFWDASIWEEAKKKGDSAIRQMIDEGLQNTSVTAVLVGTNTISRPWVRYEIVKSFQRGNGLLGININCIEDRSGNTYADGPNPFNHLKLNISSDSEHWLIREFEDFGFREYARMPIVRISTSSLKCGSHVFNGRLFSDIFPLYDWKADDGFANLGTWAEEAADKANY